MKLNYFDCGCHLKLPCTGEGVWSVCVCASVCLTAFACMHLCMSECLSSIYGGGLVVKTDRRSGTTWPPRPRLTRRFTRSDHLPGGPGRCAPPRTRDRPDYCVNYKLGYGRTAPLLPRLQHMCTSKDTLRKIPIRP